LKVRQTLFDTMAKLVAISASTLISLFFVCSVLASGDNCYYLQVGTFNEKQNVNRLVKKYTKFNEKVVINEVRRLKSGTMFQVIVGPFASWKEADSHKLVLRKKGIYLEDAFIKKINNFTLCNLSEHKTAQPFYYKTDIADQKPEDKAVPPKQVRPIGTPLDEGRVPEQTTPPREMSQKLPETFPTLKPSEIEGKTDHKKVGRNTSKKSFSISLTHTYSEFQTKLDERQLTTSSGGSTTTVSIDASSLSDQDYYTSFHRDTVGLHYGVTDNFEVFTDIGVAYKDLSNLNLTYGIGGRLNVFTFYRRNGDQYYAAVLGKALFGKIEYEYDSETGTRWYKDGDWQYLSGGCEIGAVFSKFSLYTGGTYNYYSETSENSIMDGLPAATTEYIYNDEFTGDPQLGGFIGGAWHVTKKLHLNLEGQAGNPNELAGSLKYDF